MLVYLEIEPDITGHGIQIQMMLLILKMLWDFTRYLQTFWMMSTSPLMWYGTTERLRNMEENMSKFSVSAMPADDLAPLGARSSAGTVLTKFMSVYLMHGTGIWRAKIIFTVTQNKSSLFICLIEFNSSRFPAVVFDYMHQVHWGHWHV